VAFISQNPENFSRSLAVFENSSIRATAGAFSFQMTVPGGALPTAGVSRVTVLPTHRRRGLLTGLMRRQLDDIHERGEPLAILYSSEAPIYGRFGYGVASFHAEVSVPKGAPFARRIAASGSVGFVDGKRAREVFPAIWEEAKPGQPGMVTRDSTWWDFWLEDAPDRRPPGTTPLYHVTYEEGSRPLGFATYRLGTQFSIQHPDRALRLERLMAASPAAYGALWRFLLDVDLVTRIEAEGRPAHEPLPFLLTDFRQAQIRRVDGIWVRLVDVEGALAGRDYASPGRLAIEVRDAFCEWNQGVHELEVPAGQGVARCRRVSKQGDIALDISALASCYLGGVSFRALARAGLVEERSPGALARADAMFASDPPPWCPVFF
jgi:predicted acetyltransferase